MVESMTTIRDNTVTALERARRIRVLRQVIDDPDDPHHDRLVALCDMLIDTEYHEEREQRDARSPHPATRAGR
jgi:hypothetical protein